MTFDTEKAYALLHPYFRERVRRDQPLASHSAFGVGGPADISVTLESTQELVRLVGLCAREHFPLLVIGNGTNILFADSGVHGIVARMTARTYHLEEEGADKAVLIADAGVSWSRLLQELIPLGWAGLEFGVGIPGTLGGGVVSNAGAHKRDLGQHVRWIEVLDARGCNLDGEDQIAVALLRCYDQNELDLGDRHSRFREQRCARFNEEGLLVVPSRGMIEPAEIILRLAITLSHDDPQRLRKRFREYQLGRKLTEPSLRHAGPVFKDPPGDEAGRLIKQAGLEGLTVGKARVSTRDANYLVNMGGAHAIDVASLITLIHRRVREHLGVDLKVDIELHGDWEETLQQMHSPAYLVAFTSVRPVNG